MKIFKLRGLYDSAPDTIAHRQMVVDYATTFCERLMDRAEKDNPVLADYAADFCDDIMKRAERHDESKLHEPEKERFDYVGTHQHLGKHAYGSEEYKKSLEYLGPALKHHYEVNDHHPEHFENGIDGMNLMQVVELFCDWAAACHRNKNGNIYQSLEHNKDRFKLSDGLYAILKTTADVFEGKETEDLTLMGLVRGWLYTLSYTLSECNGNTDIDLYDCLGVVSEQCGFSDQVYRILLNTAKTTNKDNED